MAGSDGKAQRVWLMDRGIPTEASLTTMREADLPIRYLVGTPKGQLSKLEKACLGQPCRWSMCICAPPTSAL
jgi:hypothetical protein